MHNDPTKHLHIEVAHFKYLSAGFSYQRKRVNHHRIGARTTLHLLFKDWLFAFNSSSDSASNCGSGVDLGDDLIEFFEGTVVTTTEDFDNARQHGFYISHLF